MLHHCIPHYVLPVASNASFAKSRSMTINEVNKKSIKKTVFLWTFSLKRVIFPIEYIVHLKATRIQLKSGLA